MPARSRPACASRATAGTSLRRARSPLPPKMTSCAKRSGSEVFIACTLLDSVAIIVQDKRCLRALMWCVPGVDCNGTQPEVLRKIKDRRLVPLPVATRSTIAESACPNRCGLLLSRIFARVQTTAIASRVDEHRAAEFKWHQASNPAGVVRSGEVHTRIARHELDETGRPKRTKWRGRATASGSLGNACSGLFRERGEAPARSRRLGAPPVRDARQDPTGPAGRARR